MASVIFDFGANIGQNLKYYLLKADKVVCVEANPKLIDKIKVQFTNEIKEGKLIVENIVLVDNDFTHSQSQFFINEKNHELSSIIQPQNQKFYNEIMLNCKSVNKLIKSNISKDDYILLAKFDLENFDNTALKALLNSGYVPDYISVEAHTQNILESLVSSGKYHGFKVVNGYTVAKYFQNVQIREKSGKISEYSFKDHSAGPFGDDISGPWLSKQAISRKLKLEGFGWKDICATSLDVPIVHRLSLKYLLKATTIKILREIVKKLVPLKFRRRATFSRYSSKLLNFKD